MAIEKYFHGKNQWAVILGGSSGFGLATAQKLAAEGMHLFILHRDRRKEMPRIEKAFAKIRGRGVHLLAFNADALQEKVREETLAVLANAMENGKVRLLLHAIAKGNLKPMLLPEEDEKSPFTSKVKDEKFVDLYDQLYAARNTPYLGLSLTNQDFRLTLDAMALSLYDWVKDLRFYELFASDARVIGLTSEGNTRAWKNYAAVSAAKAALEAICRSIALEFAPYGIRCNVVQAGVTDTPSLRLIPGSEHLKLGAILRNPFNRLTRVEDVANVIYLLSREESAWINGAIIPVDGGEKNS